MNFELYEKSINHNLTFSDAVGILQTGDAFELFYTANKIREKFKSNKVDLCSIINAKSGRCSENCGFCAQSGFFNTKIQTYAFLGLQPIIERAKVLKRYPIRHYSIVTSGLSLSNKDDFETLKMAISAIKKLNLLPGVSIGLQTRDKLIELKEAGLYEFHHNLETSREFFPKICTTHSFDKDINVIKIAKELNFYVCSGGIFGLGESIEDRVSLAFELKNLNVDSVPINFLIPIDGTPLEHQEVLKPLEALKIISLFRCVLPDKDIRICGGREFVLKDLHPFVFFAGANGIMVSDYLTQKGRLVEDDLTMLNHLNLDPNIEDL